MGRILLHVGTEKTGTTSLQQRCAATREQLRGLGVSYPADFAEASAGHHNLGWWLRDRDEIFRTPSQRGGLSQEETWARLAESDAAFTFLSSETLYGLSSAAWRRLRELAPDARIEAVLVLRRRSDLASSLWRQRSRTGVPPPFAEFVLSMLAGPNHYLDYEAAVRRIASQLGHDALHIVVYDRLVADGEELLDFLLRTLMGIAEVSTDLPGGTGVRANQSLGFAAAEVLRHLQHRARGMKARLPPVELARRFEVELGRSSTVLRLVDLVASLASGSQWALHRLDALYREQDERLIRRFGDRLLNAGDGRESLFGAPPSDAGPVPFFDLHTAREWPEIEREIAVLLDDLVRRWK